uniref:Uncharacterized protein n=1 Tax=Sphaerodactylus townsendi TaxID=933632 RepID=A0ACB8FIH5_9SAUR
MSEYGATGGKNGAKGEKETPAPNKKENGDTTGNSKLHDLQQLGNADIPTGNMEMPHDQSLWAPQTLPFWSRPSPPLPWEQEGETPKRSMRGDKNPPGSQGLWMTATSTWRRMRGTPHSRHPDGVQMPGGKRKRGCNKKFNCSRDKCPSSSPNQCQRRPKSNHHLGSMPEFRSHQEEHCWEVQVLDHDVEARLQAVQQSKRKVSPLQQLSLARKLPAKVMPGNHPRHEVNRAAGTCMVIRGLIDLGCSKYLMHPPVAEGLALKLKQLKRPIQFEQMDMSVMNG